MDRQNHSHSCLNYWRSGQLCTISLLSVGPGPSMQTFWNDGKIFIPCLPSLSPSSLSSAVSVALSHPGSIIDLITFKGDRKSMVVGFLIKMWTPSFLPLGLRPCIPLQSGSPILLSEGTSIWKFQSKEVSCFVKYAVCFTCCRIHSRALHTKFMNCN